VEDAFSILALMSWFLETNFRQELFAISAYRKIGKKELDDLFPSHPGADLPSEEGYERIRNLRLGHVLKVAKAFLRHRPICPLSEASNNWVIKRGPKGRPMLANDPHLALFVPGIWYLCHLSAPGLEVAGASIAGMPGIVIGHNSKVAWGFTNLMVDIVDIFVLKVDPRDPSRYFLGDDVLEMERQKEVICNKGGKCEERFFHKTRHGPVITQIKEGIDAVAVLKWPGTLEGQDWEEHSFRGLLGLMKARDVREAVQAGIHFTLLGLNLVVADVQGNIAWHATGGVPSRRGYSGRLPTYASEGDRDWIGRLPYSSLPHQYNPNSGWTATANQRVAADGGGPPITYLWCAQYRWERIASLLAELKDARIEDFARIQMDTHSMQAERILPAVLSHGYDDKRAIRAAEILRQWDREVTAQSKGAAVYEVFLTEWIRELLEDELGDDLELYYHSFPGFFLIQDVILQRPSSPLWDRKDTLKREEMREILERALVSTMRFLEHELGMDEDKWSWGGLHEVAFCHPGGRNWFLAPLLGRGPYPAGGDNHTVNVAGFIPIGGRYDVLLVPSMRMIIPMGELDRTKVIAPMGQSGQPFHPNYDDMIEGWRKGEFVELRFSRESVNRAAIKTLLLLP
jgi:acyl-homoserine lactone acylase PvdQ